MKSGIATIIAGLVLFVLGAFVLPLACVLLLVLGHKEPVQFKVPGTQEINVEKPGRYYLWNDFQTVYEGKSYDRSEHLPDGMEIKIRDSNGTPLRFVSDGSMSSKDNDSARNTVGYVEIENPGKVKIEVSGGNEERIVSFEQSQLLKMAGFLVADFGVSALVALGGFALGIWGVIKLVRSNK